MTTERPSKHAPFSKVVCLGLDGATFDVIDPMVAQGRLPILAKLLSAGARAPLASTIPPLSAPAWVSFMTGLNPGQHGVFHFRAMERGALSAGLVGSWAYRGRTIFDHASRAGLKVVAFGVPMTYPPWPVNGVMVSGFPTPDTRVTYSEPAEVGRHIGSLLKLSPVSGVVAGVEALKDNFEHYLARSTEALVHLLEGQEVDLFCHVNSVTDWAAHKFWKYSDPAAPGYEPYPVEGGTLLESFYEQTDTSLSAILDAIPSDALVVILSDHGTGPRSQLRFSTNAWLASLGLFIPTPGQRGRTLASAALEQLRARVPGKTALKQWVWRKAPALRQLMRRSAGALTAYGGAIDWGRTNAYRVSLHDHVEGVKVNLAGREPAGSVQPSDYESVRDRVLEAAGQLIDPSTGTNVIEAAYRREELYVGDHAHLAPDIVLILNSAYEFAPGTERRMFTRVAVSRLGRSSATHRPDGILVMAGPGVREGYELSRANLVDVPATILWALGLEVPQEMDGQVLTEVFDGTLVTDHPVRRGGTSAQAVDQGVYSAQEEAQLAAHLNDLGYL
ncbi:MAG: alkaline phosphatase family protein [Egibacteraceae bacterium]